MHNCMPGHSNSLSIVSLTNRIPFCKFTWKYSFSSLETTCNILELISPKSSPRSCAILPTKVPCLDSSGMI
ncbi:unnamed protein product [Staurois parvus]|uniref:Uncharacterized protein n=1 Tax=Staurois parvus TaxID=386267 RepID=A0ABN9EB65_9NEOB|nr:unnamed protein product [Staurois parvus]